MPKKPIYKALRLGAGKFERVGGGKSTSQSEARRLFLQQVSSHAK